MNEEKTGEPPEGGGPQQIPLFARIAFRILLPKEEREFFLGDLEESGRDTWAREVIGAASLRMGLKRRALLRLNTPRRPRKGDGMFREILSDLRFGFRTMVRSPGFTTVALVTMALGIGANTAIFSLVNGVVLAPLPYPEADRIIFLTENNLPAGFPSFSISPANYLDWQARNRSTDLMAAYQRNTVVYSGGDRPQSLSAYKVTEGFLEILGGEPVVGRGIAAEDLSPEGEPVAVLAHGFWESAFGGDPAVLGRTMVLDGMVHTVVGILPEGWRGIFGRGSDIVIPIRSGPWWELSRSDHHLRGLGRMLPGMSVKQARADFSSIAASLAEEYPDSNGDWGAVVRPLKEVVLGSTGPQLWIFLASVGLVLLIACANLANMTLARAMIRTRELAIRTAVGAGRGRVVRQLLAESVLLSVVGGALGVGLAWFGLEAFVAGWPEMLPRLQDVEVNSAVFLFSLGLSLSAGVVFGLAPALSVTGSNVAEALRQGSRSLTGNRGHGWMRRGLVVGEVGLAVILLVGTGLLVRSFSVLRAEDPGFERDGRLILATPLPRGKYTKWDQVRTFGGDLLARMGAIPGVESVALTSLVPLGGSDQIWGYWLEANALPGVNEDGSALFYRVSPGYFETIGIPLLAGRGFNTDDRDGEMPVVVVSESFSERHFEDQSPVGQRIKFGRDADDLPVEIVGVVRDVQHYGLGENPMPQVYVPFAQRPTGNLNWVVEASIPPLSLVPGIREAVEAVDPEQPLVGIQAAEEMISGSIATPRFRMLLMTGFGLTALLLAVVGLYGVMAYSVSQRSKEIGVRMALGASRSSVLGLVFKEGIPVLGVGLAIGLGGAFALSRILESMLFGVGARDLGVFTAVPLVLASVAVLAMLVPARRATRVDPVKTLGEE